jgi:acyl-CoA reductase-like NAD-dependent aldehyde dehydrogenase
MAMAVATESAEKKERPRSGIISISPSTGRELGEVEAIHPAEADELIARARTAQAAWYALGLKGRIKALRNLLHVMHRNTDRIVDVLVAEAGKPRFEALVELWPTLELIAHHTRIVKRVLTPHRVHVTLLPHRKHWVERRPYGVVLVISPWNFPLLLSMTPVIEALLTGNTVVLKPSEFSTQLGELLTELIYEAGIPNDVFQLVHGAGDVGAALVNAHPDKIVFTGSTSTGRKIAAVAGQQLIPITLELGGKDAAIVLEDADLDRTAAGLTWAGLFNAGQMCVSIERVYVRREVANRLVEKMAKIMDDHVRVGPGEHHETTMGSIITPAQLEIIDRHIREAVDQGAQVIVGGHNVEDSAGRFYVPTLITNVKPDMAVLKDETFGPVIAVVPVDSDEEALTLANASSFGLTGSVWTRNRVRGIALARRMRVGNAGVNDHVMSSAAPNVPWGGVGDSGYGRTRGAEGLLDMTYAQSMSIERIRTLPREFFWYPYSALKLKLLRRAIHVMYAPGLFAKLRALFSRL